MLTAGSWVNRNNQDADDPKCSARYVGHEVYHGGEADAAIYAATPPLEAKRTLFSTWTKEQSRGGAPLKPHVLDVRKAYFNGRPQRPIDLRLPPTMGLGRDIVGKRRWCIYGNRNAGAIWEQVYTKTLLQMGCVQGSSSPCCFTHQTWGVSVVCHGDDFTALGTDAALDKYEQGMAKAFDCGLRGRMGREDHYLEEVKILNRVLRVTSRGRNCEADPRHTELLARALGLEACGKVRTPGAKNVLEHELADGIPEHEDKAREEVSKRVRSLQAEPHSQKVQFKSQAGVREKELHIKLHPRQYIIDGPVGACSIRLIPSDPDPIHWLTQGARHAVNKIFGSPMWIVELFFLRRNVLLRGAAWETPTSQRIAFLNAASMANNNTFVRKRVGCKAAKRLEQLDFVGEVLSRDGCTMFRALSARAMHLALDHPDIQYYAKE